MGRPFDREAAILSQFRETLGLAQDIINGGLIDPEVIELPVLRELVTILGLAMRYLNTIGQLQISNPDKNYFVSKRRKAIISAFDGLIKLTKSFTAEVRKSPLDVTARTLATLTVISRKAFDMLSVLLDAEAAVIQEKARKQAQGMTAEEAAMIEEFKAMEVELGSEELEHFEIGDGRGGLSDENS